MTGAKSTCRRSTGVAELQNNGIELTAVWFPGLDASRKEIAASPQRSGRQDTALGHGRRRTAATPELQRQRVVSEAGFVRSPRAASAGCSVAFYNHGGWFGGARESTRDHRRTETPQRKDRLQSAPRSRASAPVRRAAPENAAAPGRAQPERHGAGRRLGTQDPAIGAGRRRPRARKRFATAAIAAIGILGHTTTGRRRTAAR